MSVLSRIELVRAEAQTEGTEAPVSHHSWESRVAQEKALSGEVVESFDTVKEHLRRDVKNILESTFSLFQEGSLQALVQVELIRVLPDLGVFLGD